MNLVGKIMIVLILIMSVVFMSLAMAVYSTHRNWREDAETLQAAVTAEQAKNGELTTKLQALDAQLAAENSAYGQQIAKLETEREQRLAEQQQMQADLATRTQRVSELTAAYESTQENLTKIEAEVRELRDTIRAAQQDRDGMFARAKEATDGLHETRNLLVSAREQNAQLRQQVGRFTQLAAEHDIDPNAAPEGLPPPVDGEIVAVRRNNLIQISIGSDDGIRVGHTVELYRQRTYLGRAEIVETAPDKAVAKILKQYRRGLIQKGDHVATRLKLS